MAKDRTSLVGCVAAVAALALALPAAAQQPATDAPVATAAPSKEKPLKFSAAASKPGRGQLGMVYIDIERWTTDAEREMLLKLVGQTTTQASSQNPLRHALENIEPRTGTLRIAGKTPYNLKYCYEKILPDGTRQIVIASEKSIKQLAAKGAMSLDYPFSIIELRIPKDGAGEGRILAQTAISVREGRLHLDNYGNEPVRLRDVKELQPKD